MDSVETAGNIGDVIVLKTDSGTHSPEQWGGVTTVKIMELIVVEPSASLDVLNDVERFRAGVLGVTTERHRQVQNGERAALAEQGIERLNAPIDPSGAANQALAEIIGVAGETVLRDHFQRQDAQTEVYRILGQLFSDNIHVERCWYADQHRAA